jgi:hypothetical protein
MVMPREFAVFKLMTSSNLVDCSTGRSARFDTLQYLVGDFCGTELASSHGTSLPRNGLNYSSPKLSGESIVTNKPK